MINELFKNLQEYLSKQGISLLESKNPDAFKVRIGGKHVGSIESCVCWDAVREVADCLDRRENQETNCSPERGTTTKTRIRTTDEIRRELDIEVHRTGIEIGPRYGVLTRLHAELRTARSIETSSRLLAS